MSFCEFSNEVVRESTTMVDNIFVREFMPLADGDFVKVYMYGLYMCSVGSSDNSLDSFEKVLKIDKDDILSIYYYWQEKGLVQVVEIDPIIVRYLPVKNAIRSLKKYNVDKYTSFNISAQALMGSKMLTPREFEEFYYLIENLGLEKEAMLKIIDYCVKQKSKNISVSYITTVAKNWVYGGVRTGEEVDNKIEEILSLTGDIQLIAKALGLKRKASIEEGQQVYELMKKYEFETEFVLHLASICKGKGFDKLNKLIEKCYTQKLESKKEVDDYLEMTELMFDIAKKVCKNLGLWYDNLEIVVDTYISKWIQLGFESDAITQVSGYAFKSGIKTLEGLDKQVSKMHSKGLITSDSIDGYIEELTMADSRIKEILVKLGIDRNIGVFDRNLYNNWIYVWKIEQDVLDYAIELSTGNYMPMQYLNRILSEYYSHNITSLADAKKYKLSFISVNAKPLKNKDAQKREYTKKELDSLFDDITEIEI